MKYLSILTAICILGMSTIAQARDQVHVAGSSTVLPYANIVAEQFGKRYNFKTPIIESGGSSAGLKLFCSGMGPKTIDIANSSRAMRPNEVEACAKAGVTNILEVRFGYDGIVFATDVNGPEWKLTPVDVYLALNERSNAKTWKDVNPNLPAWEIAAYIPGEKHGTREVFEEKVLLIGCKNVGQYDRFQLTDGMDKKAAHNACVRVRKDGAVVDIDGDYTETLNRLASNKTGVGVFGLSFYENNTDKLRVATMNDVVPSVETISTGEYPVSRPLFFYVKIDHMDTIPGLFEFVEFFTSERMIGEDGPLAEYGLVPMPENEFVQLQSDVKSRKSLK